MVELPWYQCGADLGAGKAAILYDADILGYFNNVPGSSSQAGNLPRSAGRIESRRATDVERMGLAVGDE